MRIVLLGTLTALTALLTACSSSTTSEVHSTPSTADFATTSASNPPVITAVTSETEPPRQKPFPPGYPQKVSVSSLPSQVRNWIQMEGHTDAVAVAPGVWAPLPPGASME